MFRISGFSQVNQGPPTSRERSTPMPLRPARPFKTLGAHTLGNLLIARRVNQLQARLKMHPPGTYLSQVRIDMLLHVHPTFLTPASHIHAHTTLFRPILER
ncbi:hypothetical protein [Rubritalea tangerina]|uniref:hypothetical protein n=1 Tax=Rubritalea tangerina TaxID=430798 RepID=UPI0036241C65